MVLPSGLTAKPTVNGSTSLRATTDQFLIVADGQLQPFDGDMDDYAKFVLDRAKQAGMKPSQIKHEPVAEAAPVPAAKPVLAVTAREDDWESF
mgnify:CR=1 FL=1